MNMSHCRFENTERDLGDCADQLEMMSYRHGTKLSTREVKAAKALGVECLNIVHLLAESIGKQIEDMEEDEMEKAVEALQEMAATSGQAQEET